jgi:F-type H+-transporting ATPase subunit a
VSKLGCSSRLVVILGIVLLALFLTSFVMGPLGVKFFNLEVPKELQVSKPHVVLPSEPIFHVGEFKVTNTLISSWVTIILLCALFEVIVDGIYNAIEGVAGPKNVRTFFPLVTTIFLYVVTNALLALVPLWGTWGPVEHYTKDGHTYTITVPFLRAANTDINLTLSIALISFLFIEYLGFSRIGPLKYLDSFFQFSSLGKSFADLFKGNGKAFISGMAFGFINIYVGLLEVLSHFIRIISFTFRLFGNMTAGEILLGVMTFLVAFIAPIPFYGLETLVGLLQAMIFAGLTLVFGVMAVTSHHEEGAEHN